MEKGMTSLLPHKTGVFNASVLSGEYLYVFGSLSCFRSGLFYFTAVGIFRRYG
uniref:Uncharacterized protein n=1 Tax=Anguilla anguilla TaxID=7936 RepID=A0A0E9WHU1_ANGAN